jgi:hypothetical protein
MTAFCSLPAGNATAEGREGALKKGVINNVAFTILAADNPLAALHMTKAIIRGNREI